MKRWVVLLLVVTSLFFLYHSLRFRISRGDLDSDHRPEIAFLWRGRAYLIKQGRLVWQSDSAWEVERLAFGDANNDGQTELLVSLWKIGSYGSSLPFWLTENTKEWGNHLFLYRCQEGKLKLIWGSSTLDEPIAEMKVSDVNGDGKNELVVWEKEKVGVWRWQGFNFVLVQ